MMKIGKLLRKVRVELGLTQKEMAGNIVSLAQYSRIEKDEQQIKLDDLLAILQSHGYDLGLFFTRLMLQCQLGQTENFTCYKNQLKESFYACDIEKVKKLELDLVDLSANDQVFQAEAEIITKIWEHGLDTNQMSKQKICQYFVHQDSWMENTESLKLFTIVLHVFNFEMVVFWMNELPASFLLRRVTR